MLVRGFDVEKSKEPEFIRKRSLKDTFYKQASLEEEKDENRTSWGNELIPMFTETLEEAEIEESVIIRDGTLAIPEDSSSVISNLPPNITEAQVRRYNFQSLQKILDEKESFETKLYLALNDNFSNIPEVKVSFFEKIGFRNKRKNFELIESAIQGLIETDSGLEDAITNNNELKQRLELLQAEKKRTNNEYISLQALINGVLSNLNEEKFIFTTKVKALDTLISDTSKTRSELFVKSRERNKYYFKKTEALREVEENCNMSISDLRVSLLNILEKRTISEKKVVRNLIIMKELKELEYLKYHRKEQIDFSLDMIVRAMSYFAESKEHEGFNVKYMQRGFGEALKRIKEASFEAIEANTSFKEQATKDPRELMPYTRVSDSTLLRRTDKIILNNKASKTFTIA